MHVICVSLERRKLSKSPYYQRYVFVKKNLNFLLFFFSFFFLPYLYYFIFLRKEKACMCIVFFHMVYYLFLAIEMHIPKIIRNSCKEMRTASLITLYLTVALPSPTVCVVVHVQVPCMQYTGCYTISWWLRKVVCASVRRGTTFYF